MAPKEQKTFQATVLTMFVYIITYPQLFLIKLQLLMRAMILIILLVREVFMSQDWAPMTT